MISCSELEEVLTRLKETSGEAKVRSLVSVLDEDHDGNINIQEVAQVSLSIYIYFTVMIQAMTRYNACMQVIESLAEEDSDIQPQHIALIKHLIEREGQTQDTSSCRS